MHAVASRGKDLSVILAQVERLRVHGEGGEQGVAAPQWLHRVSVSAEGGQAQYAALPDGQLVALLACSFEMLRFVCRAIEDLLAKNQARSRSAPMSLLLP